MAAITDTVTLSAAFLAGLASFLSPCTIPLLPSYLSFVTGVSLKQADDSLPTRRRAALVLNAVLFIVGFSLVFTIFGAIAGLAGFAVGAHLDLIYKISGSVLIFFGLFILAAMKIPWLNYEKRLTP